MRKHYAVGVAAIAAIAVAGCGGSSNHNTGYGSFVAQLNSLCTQATAAVKAASGTPAKLTVAEIYNQKFQNLTPPAQLKSIYGQWNAVNTQVLGAVRSNDIALIKSLNAQSNTLASSLGAGQCVNNSG
jgi:hypothetical protein